MKLTRTTRPSAGTGALLLPLLLGAAGLGSGCATVQTALESKEKGSVEVYPVTEDEAWEISKKVFRWEGSDAIEEDRANHVMVTSSGTDAISWGTVMAAWVEPVDAERTKVTVVTKRRYQLGLFTTLTEGTFHDRFAQGVEIVKRGEPLPLEPPPRRDEEE